MERCYLALEDADWRVWVYSDVTPEDTEDIVAKLTELGCDQRYVEDAGRHLSRREYDNGLTYTNVGTHQTVVALCVASSQSERVNTFVHELVHVVSHICGCYGVPMQSEQACYLAGDIAGRLCHLVEDLY